MPKLGDVFLDVVYSEKPQKSIKSSDHAIEDGTNIIDHIKRDPLILNISGICNGPDAALRLNRLKQYADNGTRLKYIYRNYFANMIIENIDTTHDVDVKGAFKFSITLKQVTIAKPAIVKLLKRPQRVQVKKPSNKGRQQVKKKNKAKRIHVVKHGDNLWRISQKFYGAGRKYMIIYNANKKVIGGNPNVIRPGQRLVIP